jgi:hypothetical protein
MPKRRLFFVASLVLSTVIGCQPEFAERTSFVADLRILAVRSEPAEGPPGTTINYTALVGDPNGTRTDVPIQWAYCTLPKPESELNDVNSACFLSNGDFLKHFPQTGVAVSSQIPLMPENACNQFGPDIPDTKDKPPGRPADPDHSGGYYQPIRIYVDRGATFDFVLAETRISCNLPGATVDILLDYRKRYRPNLNPEIRSVIATTVDTPDGVVLRTEEGGDSGFVASPGEKVRFTVNWDPCPSEPACGNAFCEGGEDTITCPEDCTEMPKGCPGAERYVYFDLSTRTLVENRESMRVSWYTNGGSFVDDRTGRPDTDLETNTDNIWTAPTTPGTVNLWTTLRDSRGGMTWKAFHIVVQ